MEQRSSDTSEDLNPQETSEWLEALDGVVEEGGSERASYLLDRLRERAAMYGITRPQKLTTPYINTIPVEEEVPYPGDRAIERRIKSLIRWNAMAMVVRANKHDPGIGGHISTYSSLATLAEVGHNHFFHGQLRRSAGRLRLLPGPRFARQLRARVSRRAPHREASGKLPP